jgi:perosamine synthetase
MIMATSRGSVRHTLGEDLATLATSLWRPAGCVTRATPEEKTLVIESVRERFGVPHVIPFPYARTCVNAVLEAMRLPPGSEVLLTPITIGPMLEVILSLGLRPVFVDIELDTFGPDLDDLARKLERRPAAFLLTYLFGYVPCVEKIIEACRAAGTRVIEDVSHNIGATSAGRWLGTFGDAGVYSASLLKYVDGYNGAFVVTADAELGDQVRLAAGRLTAPDKSRVRGCIRKTLIWNTALSRFWFNLATYPALTCLKWISPATFEKLLGPGIALRIDAGALPSYYFEDIASIQCRTIVKHLSRLDRVLASRRESASMANRAWRKATSGQGGLPASPTTPGSVNPTFWQFVIPVKNVAAAREALFRKGVETGTTNLLDLAQASGVELPRTRELKDRRLFVPLHAHLRDGDYDRFFEILREAGQL